MNRCYTDIELQNFYTTQKSLCIPGCLWCSTPFSCLNITNTFKTKCNYLGFDCLTCDNTLGCLSCRQNMHLTGLTPNNCTCDNKFYLNPDSSYCKACDPTCFNCLNDQSNQCTACYPNAHLPTGLTVGACSCVTNKYPMPDTSHCACYPACNICQSAAQDHCNSCNLHATQSAGFGALFTCTCNAAYFPDYVNDVCSPCDVHCATCQGGTANDCLTCNLNAALPSGSAVGACTCNVGYYWNSGTSACALCSLTCKTCSGSASTQCLSCKPYAQLPANTVTGACSCVSGRIPTPDARNCYCDPGCLTCQTSAASDCLSCFPNAMLPAGVAMAVCSCVTGTAPMPDAGNCGCQNTCKTCVGATVNDCASCPNNAHLTGNPTGQCSCDSGYWWVVSSLSCEQCDSTCQTCNGVTDVDCILCKTNAALIGTPARCQCNVGFYSNPTSASCTACDSTCLTCSGSTASQCITCKSHASISSGQCVCDMYFYPATTAASCSACDVSCKTCRDGASTSCTSCKPHTHMSGSSSTCVCDSNSYFVSPGSCTLCQNTCATCSAGTASDCTSCYSGATLSGISPNTCVCDNGFFTLSDSANCQACHSSCLNCSGGTGMSQCLTCKSFSHLLGTAPNICACDDNAYKAATGCALCDSSCITCSSAGASRCTSCPSGSTLVNGTCTCNLGYFLSGLVCTLCSTECLTCSSTLASACLSCKPHSYLYANAPATCTCDVGYRRVDFSGYCVRCRVFFNSGEIKGYIDGTYMKLILEFIRAVDITDLLSCESVFPTVTLTRLGTSPRCMWSSDSQTLTVLLGQGYLLRTESISLFTQSIAGASDDCSSLYQSFTVPITFKATKRPPVGVIAAPVSYSTGCETGLSLSAAGSTGTGGQTALYKWILVLDSGVIDVPSYAQYSVSNIEISLQNAMLQGTTLNATLFVKDYWGIEGSALKSITLIQGSGLDVYLDTLSPASVRRGERVLITGVGVPLCIADRQQTVSYLWELLSTSPKGKSLSFSQSSATLNISPFTLSPSVTYTFRLAASTATMTASTTLTLVPLSSPIIVALDRSSGQQAITTDLEIDASSSFDPDNPGTELTFNWLCVEGSGSCLDKNGLNLVLQARSRVGVTKDLLRLGAKYSLTVTVSSLDKTNSATIVIEIVDFLAISVKVPTSTLRVPSGQALIYMPAVDTAEVLNFVWVQISGKSLSLSTLSTSQWLKIPEGQIETGEMYKFSLIVSTRLTQSVTIIANSNPAFGSLTCSPSSGTEISTLFSLEALSWDDPDGTDYPLTYQFAVQNPSGALLRLSLRQLRFQLNTILFKGSLTLQVEVCDSMEGCGSGTIGVVVAGAVGASSLSTVQSHFLLEWVSPVSVISAYSRTYASLADQSMFDQLLKATNQHFTSLPEIDNSAFSAHISCCTSIAGLSALMTVDNIKNIINSLSQSLSRMLTPITESNQAAALLVFSNLTETRNVTLELIAFSAALHGKIGTVPGENPIVVKGNLLTFTTKKVVISAANSTNLKIDKFAIDFPSTFLNESSVPSSSVCELRIIQQNFPGDISAIVSITLNQVGSYGNYALSTSSPRSISVSNLSVPINVTIPLNIFSLNESYSAYTKAEGAMKWSTTGVKLTKVNYTNAVIEVKHFSSFKVDNRELMAVDSYSWPSLEPVPTPTCDRTYGPIFLAGIQMLILLFVWAIKNIKCKSEKFSPTAIFEDEKDSHRGLKSEQRSPPTSAEKQTPHEVRSTESTPPRSLQRRIEIEDIPKHEEPNFWRRAVELNPVFGVVYDKKHLSTRLLSTVSVFLSEEMALGIANKVQYSDWKTNTVPSFQPQDWNPNDYISCAAALGFGLLYSLLLMNVYQIARNRKFLKRIFYGITGLGALSLNAIIIWLSTTGCDPMLNFWTSESVALIIVEIVLGCWVSGIISAVFRGSRNHHRELF